LLESLGPSTSDFPLSQVKQIGQGKFAIAEGVDRSIRRREEMVDQGLEFVRRHEGEARIYFIVNPSSNKAIDGWVPISKAAAAIAVFDPMNGRVGRGAIRPHEFKAEGVTIDTGSEVFLQLAPGQTCILKTFQQPPQCTDWSYYWAVGDRQPLT